MKIGTRSAVVLAAAALPLFGIAIPASAAGSCNAGSVCMWEDPGYNGEKYVDQPGRSGSYEIDGWDGDNEISSVINKTGKCVRLYDNDGHTGTSYFIEKGGSRTNLEQNGYDNEAESYKIFGC